MVTASTPTKAAQAPSPGQVLYENMFAHLIGWGEMSPTWRSKYEQAAQAVVDSVQRNGPLEIEWQVRTAFVAPLAAIRAAVERTDDYYEGLHDGVRAAFKAIAKVQATQQARKL